MAAAAKPAPGGRAREGTVITVRIPGLQLAALDESAAQEGTSRAALIRTAVDRVLDPGASR
jgi:hypothetical protein